MAELFNSSVEERDSTAFINVVTFSLRNILSYSLNPMTVSLVRKAQSSLCFNLHLRTSMFKAPKMIVSIYWLEGFLVYYPTFKQEHFVKHVVYTPHFINVGKFLWHGLWSFTHGLNFTLYIGANCLEASENLMNMTRFVRSVCIREDVISLREKGLWHFGTWILVLNGRVYHRGP